MKVRKVIPVEGHLESGFFGDSAFLRGFELFPMMAHSLINRTTLTVHTEKTTIAPGREVSPNEWVSDYPLDLNAPIVLPVFIGHFENISLGNLTFYYSGISRETAEEYANITWRILQFGTERFGRPPYRRFKVVYAAGMEHMSSSMLDILAYNADIRRYLYGYTYEVAHWWVPGTVVFTGEDWWFNMAFPAYFSLEYAKTVSGEDYISLWNYYVDTYKKWTDYGKKEVPLVDVGNVYMSDIYLAYGVGAYKGALVLEKIENYTGREAFYAALREFFKENRFKEGNLDEFVKLLEQKSGKEVAPFFQNLTTSTGLPT
ncbi:M1 family metallopeptidase [Thermococcus sp. Bubb.Bath]|uniref:M1 family metallopeptidase n=1 Tax=Thermococcus sp. Bubb.Bath TaxID=1638242 RepID=UPI00143A7CAC|nr:M1 family metallopeptidase [Thermococcus sp. Bubb.Bath]NJF25553.1 hypothetical protein [Thermococcus sp. Bubb.Bath]